MVYSRHVLVISQQMVLYFIYIQTLESICGIHQYIIFTIRLITHNLHCLRFFIVDIYFPPLEGFFFLPCEVL